MKKLLDLLLKEFQKLNTKKINPFENETIQNLFGKNILQMDAVTTLAYFNAAKQLNNGNMELAVNDYVVHSLLQGHKENTIQKHFNKISLEQLSEPQKSDWVSFYNHLYKRINVPHAVVDIAKDFKILCPAFDIKDVAEQKNEINKAVIQYIKTYEKLGQPKNITLSRTVNFIDYVNKEHIKSTGIIPRLDLEFLNKVRLQASTLLVTYIIKEKTLNKFGKRNSVKEFLSDMQVYIKEYAKPDNDALAEFATYFALKGYSRSIVTTKGRNKSEGLFIFLQSQSKQLEKYINEAEKKFGSKSAEVKAINQFGTHYVAELKTLIETHKSQLDKEIIDATGLMGRQKSYLEKRKVDFVKAVNNLPFLGSPQITNAIPKEKEPIKSKLKI